MSRFLRWLGSVLIGLAGIVLLSMGVPKLPAEMIDLPANGAAQALAGEWRIMSVPCREMVSGIPWREVRMTSGRSAMCIRKATIRHG